MGVMVTVAQVFDAVAGEHGAPRRRPPPRSPQFHWTCWVWGVRRQQVQGSCDDLEPGLADIAARGLF